MNDLNDLNDLIAQLEKAAGSDAELDLAITKALWPGEPLQWPPQYRASREFWSRRRVEHYTSSLDAALTLVPEGALWMTGHVGDEDPGKFMATVMPLAPMTSGRSVAPAIAICIAALKARAAMTSGDRG